MKSERNTITQLISESMQSGARQKEACKIVGLTTRTLQRWELSPNQADGRLTPAHAPKNKLSELEYYRLPMSLNTLIYHLVK